VIGHEKIVSQLVQVQPETMPGQEVGRLVYLSYILVYNEKIIIRRIESAEVGAGSGEFGSD
jgi:hypothetical protein